MSESNQGTGGVPEDNGRPMEGPSESSTTSHYSNLPNSPEPELEPTKEEFPTVSPIQIGPCRQSRQGAFKVPNEPRKSILDQVKAIPVNQFTHNLRHLQTTVLESALGHYSNVSRNYFGNIHRESMKTPAIGIPLSDQHSWSKWAQVHTIPNQKDDEKRRMFRSLKEEKDATMRQMSARIEHQVVSKMTLGIVEWLEDHLTPDNISEVGSLYGHLSTRIFGGTENDSDSEKSLLWEVRGIIIHECEKTCTAYLEVVQERLQTFYLAIKDKFDSQSCFTTLELEDYFRDEFGKVVQNLITENLEIWHLARVGCKTLMLHFRAQNMEIVQNEKAIVDKLIPEVLAFYNEQMQSYLNQDIYPPDHLQRIHAALVGMLIKGVHASFELNPAGKICDNVKQELATLEETLTKIFFSYCKQNQTKTGLVEEEISKLRDKSKTSYIAMVTEVMEKHPNGLDEAELASQHAHIKSERINFFKMEVLRRTAQEVQLNPNVSLLEAHIDEGWGKTSKLNSLKLEISALIYSRENIPSEVGELESGPGHEDTAPKSATATETLKQNDSLLQESEVVVVDVNTVKMLPAQNRALLEKSIEIKRQLEAGGTFRFRTVTVKDTFLEKINKAIHYAVSQNSTREKIKFHMDELDKWSSTYKR